jgi:aminoglycoside phosphotransferase (APT) family kinase protein
VTEPHGDRAALVDAPRAVRSGEELDAEKLCTFLKAGPIPDAHAVEIEQFPSGHSNLTYLVRVHGSDGRTSELVLRRPPFGNRVRSAHDMGRENTILSALHPIWPKVPRPVAYTEDESVIGAPFYLMERVRGTILRKKLPADFAPTPAKLAALARSAVETLVEIHALDWEKTPLAKIGKPEGYVERQVTGWAKRYEDAKTEEIPAMGELAAWLTKNLPTQRAAALIHNDFKYDNLVFDTEAMVAPDASRVPIRGVLDWEMATIGDPLMDLGTVLSYWVEAGDPAPFQTYTFGPTNVDGGPTRRDLLRLYDELRPGTVPDDMHFYYTFALFKNAVVAQQIYKRWALGLTKDERFAAMIWGVKMLAEFGLEASRSPGMLGG